MGQPIKASGGLEPVDFGGYLVERHALKEGELLDVLAEHWLHRMELGETIVRRGYLPRGELDRLRADFENLQIIYVA